jgi:predicted PhzF superfamily epimerase YddE/YHI9
VATLHALRVFTAADGTHGNPLGVFLAGEDVPEVERQAVALDLGFAETVFVDDAERAALKIFTPEMELPFAGHPMVGTAWLLAKEGRDPDVLRPPAGELAVRREGDRTWISARAEWSPPFEHVEFGSPAEVDALTGAPDGLGFAYCWAWEDAAAATIRARCFVPEAGVDEDEATGSATLARAVALDREIESHQGRGSVIHARPLGDGWGEVGGRVVLDHVRDYPV